MVIDLNLIKLVSKDVVDVTTGKKLGKIKDLDIDLDSGKVNYLIVLLNNGISNLFKNKSKIKILWDDILKVGSEYIIVKYEN